jgi:hypothetical protein
MIHHYFRLRPGVWLAALLAVLTLPLATQLAQARQVILVANTSGTRVSECSAVTGAIISFTFIGPSQGLGDPSGLALDGKNHLFVSNANTANGTLGAVGEYDATTGATINAAFVNDPGVRGAGAMAVDGRNHLFVVDAFSGIVKEYDATTGAPINVNFAPFAFGANGLQLDRNNHLFVTDYYNGTIGEYDATTGGPSTPSSSTGSLVPPASFLTHSATCSSQTTITTRWANMTLPPEPRSMLPSSTAKG